MSSGATRTDVAAVIDGSRFGASQKLIVAATALMIILDGADNQLLPNAIPSMMREWDLPRRRLPTPRQPLQSA